MIDRCRRPVLVFVVLGALAAGCGVRPRPEAEMARDPGTSTRDSTRSPVTEERDALLMLAAMSYTYAGLGGSAGYDISAVIAWNVEDPGAKPDFVIDRNRNGEMQGDINHAEINTLHDAYRSRWDYHVPPGATAQERRARYDGVLRTTTLYTTLEPCPMCQATITMAKVPRAVFCMEDPGLRDSATHETAVVIPTEFYGRHLTLRHSGVSACERANQAMWREVEAKKGAGGFSVTGYVTNNGRSLFKPAWDALSCWRPLHPENAPWLDELQKSTGAIRCGRRDGT
jgi:tRNA(Arg) A34 adenosine deaminase TadA